MGAWPMPELMASVPAGAARLSESPSADSVSKDALPGPEVTLPGPQDALPGWPTAMPGRATVLTEPPSADPNIVAALPG
jgi:hypothetical protein